MVGGEGDLALGVWTQCGPPPQFHIASDMALLLPLPQCALASQLSSSCVQKAVPQVCVLWPVPSAWLPSFKDGVSLDTPHPHVQHTLRYSYHTK